MSFLKPIEHLFKRIVLFLLDIFAKKQFVDSISIPKDSEYKILFIRPEKIGDVFITFPVFNLLIKHFPKIKISLVVSPECLPLVEKDIWFHKIYIYKKDIWSDIELLKIIKSEKYDAVIDLVGRDSAISLLISMFCGPNKPRIALGKDKLGEYYDFNYDLRKNNTGHVIINSMQVLEPFGISYKKSDCFAPPYIDEKTEQKANSIFEQLNLGKEKSYIVGYNLSAGSSERQVSFDVSTNLIKKLLHLKNNICIIIFAIGKDRDSANKITDLFPENVKIIPDGLTLIEASAVIKKLDMFITPDTSLVHIARSFKIPVVALYRRYLDNYKIWYPFDQPCGVVLSNNENSISDLTAERIYDEFVKLYDYSEQEGKCQISRPL